MNRRKIVLIWAFLLLIFVFFAVYRSLFSKIIFSLNYQPLVPVPLVNHSISPPWLSAKSALVMDVDSGAVLFQKNPDLKLNPASITKMVTAIVALELYPMDEVVTVKQEYPVGKNMELVKGERISIENLIYGLLVDSANDAAYVLAGQSENGRRNFVNRMNQFTREIGLTDTHFVNFDGEDDQNHYSTAFDLAHLTRLALKNNIFSRAIRLKEVTVKDVSGQIEHNLESTDELLGALPEIKGVKTGWTPKAGECFVGLVDLGDHQLITVILASEDRFAETEKLITWIKKAVSWREGYSDHSTGMAGT